MKKLVLLIALILLLGSAFGQSLRKGNIVGVHAMTITLNQGVTMEQYANYLIKTCIPEFDKARPGWKYFITKGIKGENVNSIGFMIVIKSKEDYNKYFNVDGTPNELAIKANEKVKPFTDELNKLGTWKSTYTDWEVQ